MAIIKHRPQIRLLTPPLSLVGGRSRLTTVLVGRRAFEVAEVRIDLVGRIKSELGIETMAHLTCVGSTKDEIREILKRLQGQEMPDLNIQGSSVKTCKHY